MRMSTPKQRQLIKIAQKQLCIDDAAYRQMLANNCDGVTSSTQLTAAQAKHMINVLISKGFTIKSTPRPASKRQAYRRDSGRVVRIVNRFESEKIDALAGLIAWKFEDGLVRWMEKRFKVRRVRTAREAYLVIEGLKKMFENGMKKQYGPGWWDMEWNDHKVVEYIAYHRPKGQ